MKQLIFAALLLVLPSPVAADPKTDRAAILATIGRMEASWNRGDFAGYMAGFKETPLL